MPSLTTLGVFVAAAVALILIPGPSTFYLLGRGLTAGRRVALIAALGIETGSALFVCLTAFGLSALIASTAYTFTTLHYLGAAYLVILAARALRAPAEAPTVYGGVSSSWSAYRQGFLVGASNPKVALFFLAFFPQFVRPDRGSTVTQVLTLGAVFVALGLAADTANAFDGKVSRTPGLVLAHSKPARGDKLSRVGRLVPRDRFWNHEAVASTDPRLAFSRARMSRRFRSASSWSWSAAPSAGPAASGGR